MADLPVGRFVPSPGITVDRSGTSVLIVGQMELSGPEATSIRADSVERSINDMWTRTFKDGFVITCKIHVSYRGPGTSAGASTQITAEKTAGPSHVRPAIHGRAMILNANESDAFTWTPAHEFGHILGMKDRYSESIVSKIKSLWGGRRSTTVQSGYDKNLMGVVNGSLESKNVADIIAENEPSAYWKNDDDYIVSWVGSHSVAELAKLPTAEKLRAIWILQGGWISGDDLQAMGKICGVVKTTTEAASLRRGINLLIFSDIGQRTSMRVFLSKMP